MPSCLDVVNSFLKNQAQLLSTKIPDACYSCSLLSCCVHDGRCAVVPHRYIVQGECLVEPEHVVRVLALLVRLSMSSKVQVSSKHKPSSHITKTPGLMDQQTSSFVLCSEQLCFAQLPFMLYAFLSK